MTILTVIVGAKLLLLYNYNITRRFKGDMKMPVLTAYVESYSTRSSVQRECGYYYILVPVLIRPAFKCELRI